MQTPTSEIDPQGEAPPLRVRLFGQMQVLDATGQPIEVRSTKALGLLAYLAATRGRRQPRELLASMFWAHTGERARHNLRQGLSTLRKALGDDDAELVVNDGDALLIPDEVAWVDTVEFRRLAASDKLDDLEAATKCYDELLADLVIREDPFDEWLTDERQRLYELALDATSRLAHAAAEADQPDRALEVLRRLLAMDPAHEGAHRLMMECFAATGRRSEALRQYEACEEALRRHLGTQPGQQTVALYEKLRDAPTRGPSASDSAHPPFGTNPLPLPAQPSVVVLPLRNLSGDSDQRYFSDGMSEDLTIALSQFDSLFVIARQSAFLYRDREVGPREIGRELGVGYLVDGSVRRMGARIRVTAQLVDTSTGEQVWANSYDRHLDDLFAVQDELTETIVATLVGRVQSHRLDRIRQAPTDNLDAYDCLLRGKDHHHRYSLEDNLLAEEFIARAIERDPEYAAAHAWMACVLAQRNSFTPDPQLFTDAFEYVRTAVELDEGESECHRILAAYHLMRRRFDQAEHHQERALALNPNDDRIVCQMGEISTFLGRPAEGVDWVEKALRLNPYHPGKYHGMLAHAMFDAGRPADALAALRRFPQKRAAYAAIGVASLARLDRLEKARDELARLRESSDFDVDRFIRGLPYRDPADATALRRAFRRVECRGTDVD